MLRHLRLQHVLSRIYSDRAEKLIAFASKTLNKAEVGYSRTDKEAVSIIYGIKKL